MQERGWFVYIQGETLGPLATEMVSLMLSQNRLQFADYIWAAEMPTWVRIYEVEDFRRILPPFPKVTPPTERATEQAEKPAPKPKAKPEKKSPPKEYHYTDTPPGDAVEERTGPASPGDRPPPPREFPKIRRTSRVPIAATATLVGHGKYKVGNVSEGGMFIMASTSLPIGTDLKFTLEAAVLKKPLEMTGVVIRHNVPGETPGFAVEFTRMNPAHKRLLQEYVKIKDPSDDSDE